ncbi:hypothetical protein JVV71_18965, partial [Vibrio cholerae O1]|nr:hypothetical protein [Vibrio cholerae O1]
KISSIEDSLGKLFFEFDNIEESFEHYNRAIKIREENTDSKLLDTLFNLCENHIKTKNMNKCIEILNKIKNKLKKKKKNDRESYEKFYKSFGRQLKYGVYDDFGMNK